MTLSPAQLEKENSSLRGRVVELEGLISNLELKVRALEIVQARPIRQEDGNQRHFEIAYNESVQVETEEEAEAQASGSTEQIPSIPSSTTKRKGKKRVVSTKKFENLPVSKKTVLIPEEVRANPDQWKEIGETVTQEVLVHPTTLSLHEITTKTYKNAGDRDAAPITAKAPVRFSASYVSISLAVYIVLGKYLEHGTLYRLEQKFARLGADITRQSQSDVVQRLAHWTRPLYELIEKKAKAGNYLQIDETFIDYINGRNPGKGQGYFWAIHAPGQSLVFKWIDNRRHENVDNLVFGFNGILQSDGYAAYANYARTHPAVTLAACWAHAFRKFRDAIAVEPEAAKHMMKLISDLYDLEEEWDKREIPDSTRQILRERESLPIVEKIKARLDAYSVDMSIPNNEFRKAVNYTANQWTALKECLNHGHTRLDTNLLESKFRPTKIGAKNWLFIGHPEAGEKSAIVYTLLNCCRIHRINPQAYLTDILEKLVPCDHRPSAELLESLLPENWALANPDKIIKEPPAA